MEIRAIVLRKQLSNESMIKFIEEHKYKSLNFLINQKYEEIKKKNKEMSMEDIDEQLLKNKKNFSRFSGINITSVEDIEYKKNVLLLQMKEDIKNKINEGKYDLNELENFHRFENNIWIPYNEFTQGIINTVSDDASDVGSIVSVFSYRGR